MNVLVLAPHPDDEAIGCGGAICNHVARGDRVSAVFLTSGELALQHLTREEAWRIREEEAGSAGRILGLAQLHFLRCPDWGLEENRADAARLLQAVLHTEEPQLIYLPHLQEAHPDHQAVARILGTTLKKGKTRLVKLRAYEIWTPLTAHDHAEDISTVMARKLRAVRSYRSQLPVFPL